MSDMRLSCRYTALDVLVGVIDKLKHIGHQAMFLAERVGFEPTERFPVHSISSAASSTTPAPLREMFDMLLVVVIFPSKRSERQRQDRRISNIKTAGGEGGIRTHGGR